MTLDDVCRVLFAFNVKHILKWWTQCAGRIYTNSTHIAHQRMNIYNHSLSQHSLISFVFALVYVSALHWHICPCMRMCLCIRRFTITNCTVWVLCLDMKHMLIYFCCDQQLFLVQQVQTSWCAFFICPTIIKGSISSNSDKEWIISKFAELISDINKPIYVAPYQMSSIFVPDRTF